MSYLENNLFTFTFVNIVITKDDITSSAPNDKASSTTTTDAKSQVAPTGDQATGSTQGAVSQNETSPAAASDSVHSTSITDNSSQQKPINKPSSAKDDHNETSSAAASW